MTNEGANQRIWIIGAPGSGKTTLANQLKQELTLPHYELDALFWQANWKKTDKNLFIETVHEVVKQKQWVVDGQYSSVHHILAEYADTIIWLDVRRRKTFPRLIKRTFKRLITREKLWNGNKERMGNALQFFSYAFHVYPQVIYQNEKLFHKLKKDLHVKCLRIDNQEEADEVVMKIKNLEKKG
ncbi:AAA family ATPase [Bacillus pumilus]|uniref:AAA family ATPase n=1 Tax=Bacillus pumilus TaxID=1408 RepID=UPI0011E90BF0|nr:AAA family ATPase [Bacillus pumilus]TYS32540.1 adenylate kinase [Bacillus pumilus]TYS49700.1 adenylate kinase [Bacillus pumilus]